MLYPNKIACREDYMLWTVIQAYDYKKSNHLDAEFEKWGGLTRLLEARSWEDIKIIYNKSIVRGALAGQIIHEILRFDQDPKAPNFGVNKITELLEYLLNIDNSRSIKSRTNF